MKNKPTVSIILPVYNATPYLTNCLDSILNQSHKDWELIAVNDGSTDNSLSILRKYTKSNPKIKVISYKKNRGIAYALNLGLSKAKGHFIARMDADDIMYKNRLKKQIKFLEKHPKYIIIGGQCTLIDHENKISGEKTFPTKHKDIYEIALLRAPLQHPAVMINRKLLPKNFRWYKTSNIPAEDLDLFFRLFRYGKSANLPQKVIKYRLNKNGLSLSHPLNTFMKAQKVRAHAQKYHNYSPTLLTQLTHAILSLVITTLPDKYIYSIYQFAINPKITLKIPSIKLDFTQLLPQTAKV